jgi:hypothetical protein
MAKSSTRKLKTIGLLTDLNAPLKSQPIKPRQKRQAQLALDPMPTRIEPQLTTLATKVPNGVAPPTRSNGTAIVLRYTPSLTKSYHYSRWPRLDTLFPVIKDSKSSRSREVHS